MVDFLITPASGTAAISDSSGVSTTPGANKLWASGTNLYWGTTQVDAGGGGGGTIGGSLSDNYIPIGSAADTVGNFVLGLTENNSIWIGSDPTSTTNTASYNVALGLGALDAITTADYNTALGHNALTAATTGGDNVAVGGYMTLGSLTGGIRNNAIGHSAGHSLTTGNYNDYIGYQAGYENVHGDYNVGVGRATLEKNAPADDAGKNVGIGAFAGRGGATNTMTGSVFIGYASGYYTTGNANVAVGYGALEGGSSTYSANKNVAIGYQALKSATTAENVVAIGYLAGDAQTTDDEGSIYIGSSAGSSDYGTNRSLFIGFDAGNKNTTGQNNLAIGHKALEDMVSGIHNTSIGREAGKKLTGNQNVAIGTFAMQYRVAGYYNTAIGDQAMRNSTAGDKNVIIGTSAMGNDTAGTGGGENVGIGFGVLRKNTGMYNVILGASAVSQGTGVNNSVIIGREAAGAAAVTGDDNVIMGYRAAYDLTSGYSLVAIGYEAGANVTTANRNIYIGYQAGHAQVASAEYSVMIGELAGYDVSGQRNLMIGGGAGHNAKVDTTETTFIGYNAGANASGTSNTFVGSNAGASTNAGNELTAVGKGTLSTITGSYNTAIGFGVMADGAGSGGYNTGVGQRALQAITNGGYNTAVGVRAGAALSTQSANTLIGTEAGSKINTSNNTVVGMFSAQKLAGGSGHNVIIGDYAARGDSDLFSGSYNTVVGSYAASKNTLKDFSENTVIGHKAASGATSMSANVIIGEKAAMSATTASYNTIIGHEAGYDVTTATENTYIGYNSGRVNNANYNVVVGNGALETATGVANSVIIGRQAAGAAAATGDDNVIVGYKAGYDLTSGYGNAVVGNDALGNLTEGYSNVGVGNDALFSLTTGRKNIAVGNQAGYSANGTGAVFIGEYAGGNSTANYNVIIGYQAGDALTSAGDIVAIGEQALGSDQTGGNNVAIGREAMRDTGNGTHNVAVGGNALSMGSAAVLGTVAIGYGAGYYTEGNYNTYIGYKSGYGNSTTQTDQYNTAVGRETLMNVTSGYGNVALGYSAMSSTTSGRDNTVVGLQAGQYITGGVENTAVGYLAGRNLTNGNYNTLMGWYAGYDLTSSHRNTFIGYAAGRDYNQTGDGYNVAIGMYAMFDIETGSANVAIGYNAMKGTNGEDNDYNIAIGSEALYSIAGGNADGTVAIGYKALYSNTTASGNTAVGYEAGMNVVDDHHNTFIGYQAGKGGVSSESDQNVAIGSLALTAVTTADNSVAIGFEAGKAVTTGDNQVMIGFQAGKSLTTGSDNVLIGYQAGESITIGKNNIAIGYHSMDVNVHGDDNIAIGSSALGSLAPADGGGDNVAIGSSAGSDVTTGQRNTIIGHIAGTSLTTGDGNVYIGQSAGPTSNESNKLYIHNAGGTPLIGGDFSSGGTLTFTASGNAPYSTVFKSSQVSSGGEDGIAIDAREPRLSLINRRDTDETWKIMANNGNSSLQIVKDSQLVKAIFSPDDGGGVTFGIAAAAATSGVAIAQGASYSLDNTTTNRIYRTSSDVSYVSNELHHFNKKIQAPELGIGTSTITDLITVQGDSNASVQLGMYGYSATNDKTAKIFLNKSANSTAGSHTAVADNDVLGLLAFRGSDGDSFEIGAQIRGQATQDFAAGARGTDLIFSTVDNSTTTLDDKMVLTQAGYVGIGTTSPDEKFHVYDGAITDGAIMKIQDAAASMAFEADHIYSSTETWFGNGQTLNFNAGTASGATHYGSFMRYMSGSTEVWRATDNGIGIGTTTPQGELHIASGSSKAVGDSTNPAIQLGDPSAGAYRGGMWTTTEGMYLHNKNGDDGINFHTRDTFAMRIDDNQKVGIGTTSPAYELDVSSTDPQIGLTDTNGSTWYLMSQSDAFWLKDVTNSQTRLYINAAGRVGIGDSVSAPTEELEVFPNTDAQAIIGRAYIGTGNSSDYAAFGHYDMRGDTNGYALMQKDDGTTYLNAPTGQEIRMRIENSDIAAVTATGLGIGTTGPTDKLHVVGTTLLDGQVNFPIGDGLDTTINDSKTAWTLIASARPDANVTGTTTLPASPVDGDYYIIAVTTLGESDPVGGTTTSGVSKLAASHTINGNSSPRTIDTQTGVGNISYFQLHCIYSNGDWNVSKGAML